MSYILSDHSFGVVFLKSEYSVSSLYIMFLSVLFRSHLVAAELEKIKRFNCILTTPLRGH